MTTCRRLPLFLRTMELLLLHSSVQVVVIDDASSSLDRKIMMQRFPSVRFILKDESERGHANSLNILLRNITTRFFFYVEDDWELLDNFAILILESNTHIDEVLLNTQWDRNCSLGYVLDSDTKFLNVGGWHRRHDFSYWPGFSLNPGLWDVPRIADKFRAICSQRKEFNADIGFTGDPSQMSPWCNFFSESDSAFEHHFSILGHLNGVHVAHLHAVLFKHIGHEVSAYKLNGFRRPWE
ncbi:unnamed protein product [Ectocarpus fasciculatus]